jgi:hypothetical protein
MLQESEIEGRKHQDNSDVHGQPWPKLMPEEKDVHTDHYGHHGEHVKHGDQISSHGLKFYRGRA